MSEAARHKQKARTFEQRENWKRAIEAYELAIAAADLEEKDADLSTFNRVGDLYRRVGDVAKAVYYYERAAEGHIAAGFYNNAVALCNKILRNQPNRHSVYLKLGKIGAAKGFLSDARKHFLEYAERMQKANQLDAAFAALVEFADLSPDPNVRLMIAEQLIENGRKSQAVEQMRLGWRDLKQDDRDADADRVRERILQLQPDRDPEVVPPEEGSSSKLDAVGMLELPELLPYDEPGTESEEHEETSVDSKVMVVPTELDVEVEDPGVEDVEMVTTSLTPDDSDELPPDVFEVPPVEEPVATTDSADVDFDVTGEPAMEAVVDLEPPAPSPDDRVSELAIRLQQERSNPGLLVELADALLSTGDRTTATQRLGEALALHEARGEYREAGRVLDELLRLNVNDVRAYQKRVELALRSGEQATLIEAYLDLADCLDRTDAGDKARAVFARVLELDGDNGRARAALEMFGEATASTQQTTTENGADDFVDLSLLVQDDKPKAKSTRFRVAAEEPQSEGEVNFSDMLNQFKAKVSEAIEDEDMASHYDLGVAYKEMGLIDEAIAEFQIAARGLDYRLRAIEMLGTCFLEKEDYRIAVKVLGRALQVQGYKDEQLVGIFYSMGRAYEALGEAGPALDYYERVMGSDLSFADVVQRVSALRQ